MKVIGIIPARYASTRFPGKPLVEIRGKSMVQRVYEQAKKSKLLEESVVATDDKRIFQHVQSFGGKVMMTSAAHQSGTDRCAEVAQHYPDVDVVINIQGDEPFIEPAQIDQLAGLFSIHPDWEIATLARKITHQKDLFSHDVVKVVFDAAGEAMYFSRQPIPYFRDLKAEEWLKKGSYYQHVGLYGYQRKALESITRFAAGRLEQIEKLEQLRWLENGYSIGVGITAFESRGIDRPEDLENL
jgi:3-deoxy-manno-octulosonate cytidylyltransferase (CMP-KDO synthetase)